MLIVILIKICRLIIGYRAAVRNLEIETLQKHINFDV